MDQAPTLPHSRSLRSKTLRRQARHEAAAHATTLDPPVGEVPLDSGEDPESPGPPPPLDSPSSAGGSPTDPLAEPLAALLGAALALVSLVVPLFAVVSDPPRIPPSTPVEAGAASPRPSAP
jgi:hypothetical protein